MQFLLGPTTFYASWNSNNRHTHTHTRMHKTNLPNELISSSQKCILTYPLIYPNSNTPISFFYSFVISHSLSLFFYLEFFLRIFFYIESVQDLKISFSHMLNIKMWITRQNYLCNSNKCAKSIQWSSLIIKHATPLNEPIYTHFRQYDLLKTSEDR